MIQQTSNKQEAIASAHRAIRSIDALANNPDFRWFMSLHANRCDSLANKILHEPMPLDERERLRARRLGLLEVLLSPKEDRAAQVRILAESGITMGDAPEFES
jgi:hypothetical protein